MMTIALSRGLFAKVDDDDFDWLNQWKWHAFKPHQKFYADLHEGGKYIYMHRALTGRKTDHENGDTLDNTRGNLRPCTDQQNAAGFRTRPERFASRFRGVSWYKATKCWVAGIVVNYKRKHLGYFKKEEDAALAYNTAARCLFGEFAQLNKVS